MSCAVAECFSQAMLPQCAARRSVDVSRPNTGLDRSDRRPLRVEYRLVNSSHFRIGLAYGNCPGQVDAVSAVDPAKVQHDQVPFPECPLTGMGMGTRRIRPARYDRLERAP